MQASVVIIECKPSNMYSWKLKLEEHIARHPRLSCEWYKPKSWEDVEKAVKAKGGDYDERSVQGHELVSKLVVDPLLDHPIDKLTAKLYHLHIDPRTTPLLVEAVKYMMTRDKGDGLDDVVVYRQWQQLYRWPYDTDGEQTDESLHCSKYGHNIVALTHKGEADRCRACQKQVIRSFYYSCENCTLALHEECAESFDNNNKGNNSPFPVTRFAPKYRFPEEVACSSCKERRKGFSDKCATCLFDTHLKCRLMPTIIKHFDKDEHLLVIVVLPTAVETEVYQCGVCGETDRHNIYWCMICGFACHYKCVTLAREVNHEHGGHHHRMSLRFSSEEAEDYLCHECQELKDPELWFYSCEDCPYELHPACITKHLN